MNQKKSSPFSKVTELTPIIRTNRLILRAWKEEDLPPFAALNADPKVMEYFPSPLTKEESDKLARRIIETIQNNGWGLFAVSVPGVAPFIGFIGVQKIPYAVPFTPTVEIGWRLAADYWNKGYATEGAIAVLKYGFEKLKLDEIVALTTVSNQRSRAVMEKIGMHHNPADDFDHPNLPKEHPLRPHVLYRIRRNEQIGSRNHSNHFKNT